MGNRAGDGGGERGGVTTTSMNYDRARTKLLKWIGYDYSRTALLKASLLLSVVTILIATLFLSFLVIVLPSGVSIIVALYIGLVMMGVIVTPLRQISRLLAWGTLLAINAITVLLVNWCTSLVCSQLTTLESLPAYFVRHCQPTAISGEIVGIIFGLGIALLVALISGVWKLKDLWQD